MTLEEAELAAKLLEMAAEEFSNHGCNDFKLPNTHANWVLAKEVYTTDEGTIDDIERPILPNPIIVPDWLLMRHLAKKIRNS